MAPTPSPPSPPLKPPPRCKLGYVKCRQDLGKGKADLNSVKYGWVRLGKTGCNRAPLKTIKQSVGWNWLGYTE